MTRSKMARFVVGLGAALILAAVPVDAQRFRGLGGLPQQENTKPTVWCLPGLATAGDRGEPRDGRYFKRAKKNPGIPTEGPHNVNSGPWEKLGWEKKHPIITPSTSTYPLWMAQWRDRPGGGWEGEPKLVYGHPYLGPHINYMPPAGLDALQVFTLAESTLQNDVGRPVGQLVYLGTAPTGRSGTITRTDLEKPAAGNGHYWERVTYPDGVRDYAWFQVVFTSLETRAPRGGGYDHETKPSFDAIVRVDAKIWGVNDYCTFRRFPIRVDITDVDEPGDHPQQQTSAVPLTASLEAPTEHDGTPFAVSLTFSEPVSTSYRTLRDQALTATNGDVTGVRRVDGSSAAWTVTVAPLSHEDVELHLGGGSDPCGQGDSVCTSDGGRLANQYLSLVKGPQPTEPATEPAGAGFTASLDAMPVSHDGTTPFAFGLTFSEEPAVSYRTLRDSAFTVTGGVVRSAGRRQQGSDSGWTITVEPDHVGNVSIRLPATTDCAATGAICTSDGVPLSGHVSATVRGPSSSQVMMPVPALPLIAQWLLGLGLMGGGARQLWRTSQ